MLVLNILKVTGMGNKYTRLKNIGLKMDVYDAILGMSLFSEGILLFYGLCGNLLKDIKEDFKYLKCLLVFNLPAEFRVQGKGIRGLL